MTWPGPPLSGDQAEIVALVDAIVGKHGAAPADEDPAEIAKAYLKLDQQPEGEWQHELVY